MKKLGLLALPFILAACNTASLTGSVQPYNIQLSALGYEVDDQGKITVANVNGQVVSSAGAPDANKITFVATLVGSDGQPAIGNDNETIVPLKGTLIAGVKGGYVCTTTVSSQCTMAKDDANFVMTDSTIWPQNAISRALVPGEWAVAHLNAFKNEEPGTAPWSVDFVFTAEQANGSTVSWKQNYQFLVPVKAG